MIHCCQSIPYAACVPRDESKLKTSSEKRTTGRGLAGHSQHRPHQQAEAFALRSKTLASNRTAGSTESSQRRTHHRQS